MGFPHVLQNISKLLTDVHQVKMKKYIYQGGGTVMHISPPPTRVSMLCGCLFLSWLLHFNPAPRLGHGGKTEDNPDLESLHKHGTP